MTIESLPLYLPQKQYEENLFQVFKIMNKLNHFSSSENNFIKVAQNAEIEEITAAGTLKSTCKVLEEVEKKFLKKKFPYI